MNLKLGKMGQEFQILRCYACQAFNVDIVKNSNKKWQCKMCGENQSVKHVYGTSSSAKECREAVQNLNQQRGEVVRNSEDFNPQENYEEYDATTSKITMTGTVSRWAKYQVSEADLREDANSQQ